MSNNKIKVCLVNDRIPPSFGGVGIRMMRYAERMNSKNCLGFILTRTSRNNNSEQLFSFNKKIKSLPPRIDFKNKIFPVKLLLFLLDQVIIFFSVLYNILALRKNFDVLHAFKANWLSLYSITVAKLIGKKTVIEFTLVGEKKRVDLGNYSFLNKIKLWLINKADQVVAISPALKKGCISAGISENKISIIANPVNTETFAPIGKEKKKQLSKKLNLDSWSYRILFVGAITKRKGVNLLVKSFLKVVQRYPSAALVLVGPNSNVEEERKLTSQIKKEFKSRKLEKNIFFTNVVDNVDEYMKISDVFVFPSIREGFGTVVVEAMSTGLPVITFRIPGISNYIINNDLDGIIFKERSPKLLADIIIGVLENKEYSRKIAINAREKAKERFDVLIIDKKYLNLYKSLL